MTGNPFLDREAPPAAARLRAALGRSSALWDALAAGIEAAHGPVESKWSWSGKAYGWALQLKHKSRAVLYLSPREGWFMASLAMGEKACAAAKPAGLSADLLAVLDAAPRFAEGRAVRIEVRAARGVANALALAAVKMAN